MEYILGNKWIWQDVEKHITSHKGIIFVLGSTGIGKSFTTRTICEHYGVDAFYIDSTNCSSSKEFVDVMNKQIQTRIIQSLAQETKRKVIIVDELETLMQFDRGILGALHNLRNVSVPIVCLGNKTLEKKITQVFTGSVVHMCVAPCETDICIWLKSYTSGTNVPCKELLDVAERSNGNLHTAIQLLSNVGASKDQQQVFEDIYTTINREQIARLLEEDTWLSTLRFHENLPKDMTLRQGTKTAKVNLYSVILDSTIVWDALMSKNHSAIALEVITQAVVLLQSLPRKKGQTLNMSSFTKLFSNLSLQKKNEKKTYSTDSGFPWAHAQIFCEYIKYK